MNIPAVVIGNGISALAALRALSRSGIPCRLVSSDRSLRTSRYARNRTYLTQNLSYEEIRAGLDSFPEPALFLLPCADELVRIALKLAQHQPTRFLHSLCQADVLELFLDKSLFAAELRKWNVAAPLTIEISVDTPTDQIPIALFPNLFLKPKNSQSFFQRHRIKGQMVTDLAELRSQLQQLNLTANEGTSCILQQWITGSPEQHIFLDGFFSKAREYSGVFARRRLRMYPQFFGNSTFMKSIDLDEVASASKALQQLFVSTGFYGIFSAEFKYDKHDEQFKLLEVNVRPWWYTEFASQNGMNAPLLSYQEALKLKPTAFAVRRGSSCIHPYYDFFALGGLRNLLSLGGVRWLYQLSVSSNPWFAWDDPAPALHQGWKTLLEIIARR